MNTRRVWIDQWEGLNTILKIYYAYLICKGGCTINEIFQGFILLSTGWFQNSHKITINYISNTCIPSDSSISSVAVRSLEVWVVVLK